MALYANGNIYSDLARLDEDAARAGCALACTHQSAEELHREMIERYFALHPRRWPFGYAVGATALAAFLILVYLRSV
jgi:hypothetical protein